MKFTSVTRGIGYVGGTSDVVEVYPIASNIKQEFIITEIGSATSVSVRAMRSVSGINPVEVGSSTIKNLYEGMRVDLSAFAPLFGDDAVTQELRSADRSGNGYQYALMLTPNAGGMLWVRVYPIGCTRFGFTGGESAFSDYNYAYNCFYPTAFYGGSTLPPEQAVKDATAGIMGLTGAVRVQRTTTAYGFACDILAANAFTKHGATMSMYIKNTGSSPIEGRSYPVGLDGTYFSFTVAPGESKRLVCPVDVTYGSPLGFSINGAPNTLLKFRVSRLMIHSRGCEIPYSLDKGSYLEPAVAGRYAGQNIYAGYLTDYRDGYFNRLENVGEDGNFTNAGALASLQGMPFINRIFFPSNDFISTSNAGYKGWQMCYEFAWDDDGELPASITSPTVVKSGAGESPNDFNNAFRTRIYGWWNSADKVFTYYGTERYKAKDYHKEPMSNKIALKWLNSRGAFDSMYFVDYTMTPQIGSTGVVDSLDITVKRVVDWDNEEALFYLTRSTHIFALTPYDVGQWGIASIEGNNVFALKGGNIGKTLTLKFNVKLNHI